jgi:uncharacterized lipoprotein YajG
MLAAKFFPQRETRMRTVTTLGLLCAASLLAACEHTPPTLIMPPSYAGKQMASAENVGSSGIVCTREVPTGLRQTVTRCRDSAEVDKRRALDREWAEKIPAELPSER